MWPVSTVLDSAALKGCNGELWVVFTGLAFFPPQAFQMALHSQVHIIFPPHRPQMINPGMNIVPKLAERSLFPEAGQMTENPLSRVDSGAVGGHVFSMGMGEAEKASL